MYNSCHFNLDEVSGQHRGRAAVPLAKSKHPGAS